MMAVPSLFWQQPNLVFLTTVFLFSLPSVYCFTGSEYVLDTEYSGANFFDGWDFFTGRDPTGGFVTYYSRSSSQLSGLIESSEETPAYIGVDYVNELPITSVDHADGAGRPSVRISSQRSWTHGLFIGDFDHAPLGICGTWPAFWTLGPNWPFTGEIDILEGVNKMVTNAVALHTNETCSINGDATTQSGTLGNTNCAYYPDYNVGCGVVDTRPASYSNFNSVGGGVYAMQWTSEYIRVWFFSRDRIPQDIIDKTPNPSSWGLPAANMMGDCAMDQHFQQHKIVFDTTFCGEYAGNPYVWNSTINSCALDTGYPTCDAYVAKHPEAFRDAYWSINYVRVYQLVNPDVLDDEPQYIASLQPPSPVNQQTASSGAAPSPTASLCPTYNFTTIEDGGLTYEVECDFDPPGPDLPPPYTGYRIRSLEDCIAGCTYWNTVNGTNLCGGVAYDASIPFCYYKKYIDQTPKYRKGFAGARLLYYGYPQITDDPRSPVVTSTTSFVEVIPIPQSYRPLMTGTTSSITLTSFSTTSISLPTILPPPLGTSTSETTNSPVDSGKPTVSFSGSVSLPVSNLTYASPSTFLSSEPFLTSLPSSQNTRATSTILEIQTTKTPLPISAIVESPSTTLIQPSSSDWSTMPDPSTIAGFTYAGCKAFDQDNSTMSLAETSSSMTLERCTKICRASYYAGMHGSDCYCVNRPVADEEVKQYPDSTCNIPCPGNHSQYCGGNAPSDTTSTVSRKKRQTSDSSATVLLTLYFNSALFSSVPSISTSTQTMTLIHLSQPTVSGQILYSITGTHTVTATVLSTTWCDYCSTCSDYQTTRSTAVTVPLHAQAFDNQAAQPVLLIPMMTMTTKCNCGINGAVSVMTVTIPCEKGISAMKNAMKTWDVQSAANSAFVAGENATAGSCRHCPHHDAAVTTQTQVGLLAAASTMPMAVTNTSNWNMSTPALPPVVWPSSSLPGVFRPKVFSGDGRSLATTFQSTNLAIAMIVVLLQMI